MTRVPLSWVGLAAALCVAGCRDDRVKDALRDLRIATIDSARFSDAELIDRLAAVSRPGLGEVVPLLDQLAAHPSEEVRFSVAVALSRIGGERAAGVLKRLAEQDPSELVREEAAHGVEESGGGP